MTRCVCVHVQEVRAVRDAVRPSPTTVQRMPPKHTTHEHAPRPYLRSNSVVVHAGHEAGAAGGAQGCGVVPIQADTCRCKRIQIWRF